MARDRVDQRIDAEFLERRPEIDRGEVAIAIGVAVERRIAGKAQFGLFADLGERLCRDQRIELRIVEAAGLHHLALEFAAVALGQQQAVVDQIVYSFELPAHPDRPGHRRDIEREQVGDLVENLEHLAAFAIDLVDEGDDRHVAQAAYFEQLARLALDALGRVDHHHGGIDRGQGTIGIFAEILVPRRVQQVERHPVPLEGHDRTGDGDAALLFDLHPVRSCAPRSATRLHLSGEMNRAAEQQQLFGQRGLAGVGVGDDRKGTAARRYIGGSRMFGHRGPLAASDR